MNETPALTEEEAVKVAAFGIDKPEDTRTVRDFTPDQIEESIAEALRDGNMPLVVSLLHALALVAPERAEVVLAAINMMWGVR